jgi:hypothetical protein
MKPDLALAIAVLKREALFEGLDVSQLARIVNYFDMIELEGNTVVFSEGSKAENFYIILSGQVNVTRMKRGRDRLLNVMGPGHFFGELGLLFNSPRTATITTKEDTVLLRLDADRFFRLMEEYPDVHRHISATAKSWQLLRKRQFDWLGDDEVIHLVTRKHWFFLIIRLAGPVFLLLLSLLGIWAAFRAVGSVIYVHPSGILGLLGLLVSLALFWWAKEDWGNDYYIVTSKRVAWMEKIIALYDSRQEAPLNTVMAVDVSSSQLGRIIGYGNVDVRTYTGSILMRNMPDPDLFAWFVKGYQKRSRAISKEEQIEEFAQAIEDAISRRAEEQTGQITAATAPPPYKKKERKKKARTPLSERIRNFLKVRYEEKTDKGVVITYRKHWFILFKRIWLPLLLVALPGIAVVLFFSGALPGTFMAFALLFGLFILGWLWYETEDWRNDIYRLTPDQIMDLEKKPLGREKKTTAPLDSPDFRVEHERKNLIGIILDFGNVKINIGQTEFTFDGVYHPDQVHQDVANYRDEKQRKMRAEEEKRERERMLDWMVAYNQRVVQVNGDRVLEENGLGETDDSG